MKSLVPLFLLLVFPLLPVSGQEPAARVQTIFQNLMHAVQTGDHAAMIINGDERFKAGLTPEMAAAVHTQMAPRMREGYSATFLTAMRQAGYEVYLWKLTFKDGKDDMLAKVVLNADSQVAGFWIN